MRPLSWLFVPGDSPRKMERARDCGAHALIFDWEDSVAPAAKPQARALTRTALQANAWAARCWIRVNALTTSAFEDDLAALPWDSIAGVVLPKACGPADLAALDTALSRAETAAGARSGATRVMAIVTETAASVLALADFRGPQPRLDAMLWGAEDLAADLGAPANRDEAGRYRRPFLLAREMMLMAAAAAGCDAIDAVYTDVRDEAGLAAECEQARLDGFHAKAAIHPAQVAVIHQHMAASEEQLAWARQVVQALGAGQGVAIVDGRMVDAPHLRHARKLLGL